jgi:hypothetical protein
MEIHVNTAIRAAKRAPHLIVHPALLATVGLICIAQPVKQLAQTLSMLIVTQANA